MADLLRQRLREVGLPAGRPRCSPVRRLSPSATRFSCRSPGLAATYRIDWEHYGTGAYVITATGPGPRREIARGTLTISE